MNVCRSTHPMTTSGYYILATHYDIVCPVPHRGAPHAPRPQHYGFRMRHVKRQWSSDVLGRVESQSFVKDQDDLVPKEREPRVSHEAIRAFHKRMVRLLVAGG